MNIKILDDDLVEFFQSGRLSKKNKYFKYSSIRRKTQYCIMRVQSLDYKELTKYPGLHYEHLNNDREGTESVRINDRYRLIIHCFAEENLTEITETNIIEATDYHDHR